MWIGRFFRAAARWLARIGDRLDPSVPTETDELVRVSIERFEHVNAGRIRKRRGESDRDFCLRVARGDYVVAATNVIDFYLARRRIESARQQAAAASAAAADQL